MPWMEIGLGSWWGQLKQPSHESRRWTADCSMWKSASRILIFPNVCCTFFGRRAEVTVLFGRFSKAPSLEHQPLAFLPYAYFFVG